MLNRTFLAIVCAVVIAIAGCSRQQSDWQKTRESNTTDAYEQFLKKYPSGEFSAQAQARLKELYEERDWQKARDADTPEAYQAFLKQYPDGKWAEEARIRVENFTLAQTPAGASPAAGASPPGATPSAGATAGAEATGAPPATTPAQSPSPAHQAKERPVPSEASRHGHGEYAVQLGAFKSGKAAAERRFEHLRKEYPKLFAGTTSKVAPRKTSRGTLYRLLAVGLSEAQAHRICKTLSAKSQACVIIRPSSHGAHAAHHHHTGRNVSPD